MSEVKRKGKAAKQVSYSLVNLTTEAKNEALEKIAVQLLKDKNFLLQENQRYRAWKTYRVVRCNTR